MALWQIIDTKKGKLEDQFDDGSDLAPGDEGFSSDAVRAYAGAANFNYLGTPTRQDRLDKEAAEATATTAAAADPQVE